MSADVCLTPNCVLAASELLLSRSPNYETIDPCDDFRAYMCEGFDETHDLRPDQSDVMSLTVMSERGQTLLRHILEAPFSDGKQDTKQDTDQVNFAKLQDAYGACMNESSIKSSGATPLVELVSKIQELYPDEGAGDEKTQLSEVMIYLMSIGVEPLLDFGIQADEKDPDVNVLYLSAPYSFGLPTKEYYEDKTVIEKYSKMIVEVEEAFHRELKPKALFDTAKEDFAKGLIDLEIKLARASPSTEDRQDVTKYYNPHTLEDTSSMIPGIDLAGLIASANPNFRAKKIIIGSTSYLKALTAILEQTPKATLRTYLVWKTVQSYASAIDDDAVSSIKRFNNVLGGKEPDAKPDRWRTCLRHVDGGLGWLLSRFYIERAFSEEAKKFGDTIILDIKDEFSRKLKHSEWMSKDVRKVAIDKVHNIVQKIGYPTESPNIQDPKALQKYYSNVEISSNNYFDNILSITRDAIAREWSKAGKPVDRGEWDMTASTVNAYYNPAGNEIVFPAGIMQAPIFYPPSVPQYLSYGAFGAVSGHELSHAFDSMGRHFDQNGNYTDWWDEATVDAFKKKAECFVDEYHNFTVPGLDGKPLHVNGRLTLGENLADAGGLSAAFNSWKRREAKKPAQLLPGLQHYTKEQLFFLSYGNVWCGLTRPAEQAKRVYSDPHSPNFARIMGTVANTKEFRESFGCKVKEPTCKLW